MDYRNDARHLVSKGISVVPLKIDGSKLPAIRWKEFQQRLMAPNEIDYHFQNCGGVAAITGKISQMFTLDFDLKYQLPHQDFWRGYLDALGENGKLLEKCLVNQTRSGGYHIWIRTAYEDKSRKITKRLLTMGELNEKYNKILSQGSNSTTALKLLLNNPTETVIESRSRGSYAVISHEAYKKVLGDNVQVLTSEETNILIYAAYSLDCYFRKKRIFTGDEELYALIQKFNEDCPAEGVVKMLTKTGLYAPAGVSPKGDYLIKRIGSPSHFSAYVYTDSAMFKSFGMNVLNAEKDVMSPFEVYCALNGWDPNEEAAINALRKKYEEKTL